MNAKETVLWWALCGFVLISLELTRSAITMFLEYGEMEGLELKSS